VSTYHKRNPIKRHGDTPLAHFTIIPNELARDTDLSMHAYRAAIVIRTHADGYELSSVSLAESQRWGRARTRDALRELTEARWLVIRPYKTADGKRAFEEYHVHAARKFTPEESATLAEPVILGDPGLARTNPLVSFEPTPWSDSGQPPGLAQAIKEDYLEDQLEEQEEEQVKTTTLVQSQQKTSTARTARTIRATSVVSTSTPGTTATASPLNASYAPSVPIRLQQ
jgi:hypothetical protein